MAGTNAAAVFVIVPIDDVVAAFHAPVPSVVLKHMLRAGLFHGCAGDAIGSLEAFLTAFLVDRFTFYHERLVHMRKIQIVIQRRGDPELSRFNTPMFTLTGLDKISRCVLVLEVVGDRFE